MEFVLEWLDRFLNLQEAFEARPDWGTDLAIFLAEDNIVPEFQAKRVIHEYSQSNETPPEEGGAGRAQYLRAGQFTAARGTVLA